MSAGSDGPAEADDLPVGNGHRWRKLVGEQRRLRLSPRMNTDNTDMTDGLILYSAPCRSVFICGPNWPRLQRAQTDPQASRGEPGNPLKARARDLPFSHKPSTPAPAFARPFSSAARELS